MTCGANQVSEEERFNVTTVQYVKMVQSVYRVMSRKDIYNLIL